MQAVYGWVKNIIYFMIFLAVVNNLLADSKYEKYIRFFAGMVLILLVVSPLTGKMRLDEQISSMFQSISLYNDASDLKSRLWNMDEKRLDQILGRYQDAVEADVAAMAAADGLTCVRAQVQIDGDRNSSTYGQVKEIRMEVKDDKEQKSSRPEFFQKPLRSIGIRGTDLVTDYFWEQLDIFMDPQAREKQMKMDETVDIIRKRFGFYSVQRGLMYRDRILSACDAKSDHTVHPHGYFG